MTPPADPREALRALVEAGKAATPGEWQPAKWVNEDGTGGWAAIGPHHIGEDDDTDEPGSPSDELATLDADFIAAAANARPALAAIERKVWLDVETVRTLISAASNFDRRLADDAPALAAAEAELRAIAEVM